MNEKKKEKKKNKVIDQVMLQELGISEVELKEIKKKMQKAEGRPERTIETWFRLTSRNLYTRLRIVDAKANILITANSIIISMVLSNLYPKLDDDPHLIWALAGLILTNVISITFAIYATIPPAWSGKKSITNTDHTDLMTFEDFSDMPQEEYSSKVLRTLEDRECLHKNMISDIHTLGLKLALKYRLIRYSYLVFLYGIIVSMLLFAACHCMF